MDPVAELARLNVLLEIVADWAQATERTEVIGSIKRLHWVIEFNRCFTVLYGPEPAALEVCQLSADSTRQVSLDAATPTTRQLIARVLETRRSAVDDADRIMAMCHPLVAGETVLGALCFESASSPYDLRDYRLAHFIGESFAGTLDRVAARKAEREANRLKDEFLATLSHELRTPLNAILGWTHILEVGSRDNAAVDRATQIIKRNAQAQAQLVADILDVSCIIGGKLTLSLGLVSLRTVIEAALDDVRPAADAKGIVVETVFGDVAPIIADRDRLQQVMWNLLSNAIKFTPKEGRVRIEVQAQARDIVVTITDSGQGIDPEFLPHVFERFSQADGSSSRLHGGLGLGMAIVRHLVELHGGSVTAASGGKDQGATFTVAIPLGVRPQEGSLPELERRTETRQTGWESVPMLHDISVLIVDDDADAREIVELMLRTRGAHVLACASALEALEAVTAHPPDVVISDIAMSGQDGLEFIRQLRERRPQQGGRVTAIALTAYAGPHDSEMTLAAGFDRHMTKPVEPAELITAVAQLAVDRVAKTRL